MNSSKGYKIIPAGTFKRQAKKLVKKYPSLIKELSDLSQQLGTNPEFGTKLGNNCFKIRISIKSKGLGKRSGARIITYLLNDKMEIYLLTIYDKSEIASVTDKQISMIIKKIRE
jgi:mRNA-degrading endonuclease RelE of RelBE toxin-antitoxin system